jgi:hypothetical protein
MSRRTDKNVNIFAEEEEGLGKLWVIRNENFRP